MDDLSTTLADEEYRCDVDKMATVKHAQWQQQVGVLEDEIAETFESGSYHTAVLEEFLWHLGHKQYGDAAHNDLVMASLLILTERIRFYRREVFRDRTVTR